MSYVRFILISLLLMIVALNVFQLTPQSFIPSQGQRYYHQLSLWYQFATNNQWEQANVIATKLDPADISYYLSRHQPQQLENTLALLNNKSNKNTDDWIELARLQYLLGQQKESQLSLNQARQLDPIRGDLDRIFFNPLNTPTSISK